MKSTLTLFPKSLQFYLLLALTGTFVCLTNLTSAQQISLNDSATGLSNCNSNDGTISVYPTGGDGNNDYDIYIYGPVDAYWIGSGYTFTGLPAGTYLVYVTDSTNPSDAYANEGPITVNNANCTSNISAYVYYSQDASTSCSTDGSLYIGVTGGDGANNYVVSVYDSTTDSTFTGIVSGNYFGIYGLTAGNYSITISDAANSGDGYATVITGSVGYYSACPGPSNISAYVYYSGDASTSCSTDGSLYIYVTGGDGTNNYDYTAYDSTNESTYTGTANSNYFGIYGLATGNYSITISDVANPGDGYATVITGSVGYYSACPGPSDISAYVYYSQDASTSCSSDGSLYIFVTGGDGTNNYDYTAYDSTNGTTYTGTANGNYFGIYGLTSGNYSITISDAANSGDGYATVIAGSVGYYSACPGPSNISAYVYYSQDASTSCSSDGSLYIYVTGGDGTNNYDYTAYDSTNGTTYTGTANGNYFGIYGLTAGNYSITISDAANPGDGFAAVITGSVGYYSACPGPSDISAYVYYTGYASTSCSTDGSLYVYVTGGDGTNNYDYTAYDSTNGTTYTGTANGNYFGIYGLTAGNYSITISDAANPGDGFAAVITGSVGYYSACPGPSNISAYVYYSQDASTSCSSDGSLYVYVTGGDGTNNYDYTAYDSTNGTTYTGTANGNYFGIYGLTAGNYSITISDASNPGDGYAAVITGSVGYYSACPGPSDISAYVYYSQDASTSCSTDGSLYIYVTGGDGTNNYDYTAYDSTNGSTYTGTANSNYFGIYGLATGNYSITISDAANPGDGYATVITGSVGYYSACPGPSDISAYVYYSQDASTSCSSDGSLYIYATGGDGTNNYDYTAYDSTNGTTYTGTANGNYFGIYGLTAGNYSITISDASNPGDGYAAVITGSVGYYSACPGPSNISAYVYYSQDASTSCSSDGSLYIYVTGGDGTNNYDYTAYDSTNGGTYTGTANSNYFGIYGLATGNYSITISDAANPGDGYTTIITGSVGYYSACPGPSNISAYVYYSQDASTSCSSDGSLYIYVTGGDGTNNYDYTAYDSTNGGTYTGTANSNYFGIYGLATGNYSITISDAANPGDGYTTIITGSVGYYSACLGPSDIAAYVYYSGDAFTSCSSDGSLYVYVTGGDGTNNYDYTAYDSTNGSTYTGTANGNYFGIYGLTAGNYSITISDAANSGDGYATVITGSVGYYSACPGPSNISAYVYYSGDASTSCSTDGSLYIYVTGGDGTNNYDYTAYDSTNGSTYTGTANSNYFGIYGLATGNYSITISDAANPGDGYATVITGSVGYYSACPGPSDISAYVYYTGDASTSCSSDGSLYVYVTGGDGTNNYDYTAYDSTNGTTYTGNANGNYFGIYGLTAGNYSITISDAANSGDGYATVITGSVGYYSACPGPSNISAYVYYTGYASTSCSTDGSLYIYVTGGDGTNNYDYTAYDSTNGTTYTGTANGNYFGIYGLTAGNYSITISDAANPGDGYATVITGSVGYYSACPGPSDISAYVYYTGDASTSCSSDGSIYIYVTGGDGTNNYDYTAYDSTNGTTYTGTANGNYFGIYGLTAGNYSITISDAANPGDGFTTVITGSIGYYSACPGPSDISAYVYYTGDASTSCSSDGSLYIYVTGGDGTNNYDYTAYDSTNGSTYTGTANGNYFGIYGLAAGNYSITISDAANPGDGLATVITGSVGYYSACAGPSDISAYVYYSRDASTSCSSDGSLYIYVTGGDGTNNYDYTAYDSTNGSTYTGTANSNYFGIYGLATGNYSITISDAANSGDGYTTIITGSVGYYSACPGPSDISAYVYYTGYASTSCSTDGSLYVYVTGGDGTNNYDYTAYDSTNGTTYTGTANGNYFGIYGLTPGNYSITISDAANPGDGYATVITGSVGYYSACPGPSNISAYVYYSQDASTSCSSDGSLYIYVTGGDGTNNYDYTAYDSTNGGTYTGTANSNYFGIYGLATGNYSITISDAANPGDGYTTIITGSVGYYSACPGPSDISAYVYYTGYASTSCSSDGSLYIYVTGGDGTNNYDYTAYDSTNGSTYTGTANSNYFGIYGLATGNYSITISDAANPGDGYATVITGSVGYYSACPGPSDISAYVYYTGEASTSCSSDGSLYIYVTGGDGTNNYDYTAYDSTNGTTYTGTANGNYFGIYGLTAGNYSITISDAANPGDGYATVITGSVGYYSACPGPSDISAYVYYTGDASTSCSSDGSLYIYVTGGDGTNNYDYTAYDSTNGTTYTGTANSNYFGIYGLAADNYGITISDASNPGDGYTTVITGSIGYYSACPGPSDISAYVYYTGDASTSCSSDGSLYIYITGGDGTNNYDYTAYDSTNGTTYTGTANGNYFGIYGLTAGNYSITISDASNPGDGYAAVITGSVGYYSACPGPSNISAYVYYTGYASTSCSTDGSLYVYVTGGDGTNNYVVSVYDSTNDSTYTVTSSGNYMGIYGLAAGNYSITISDAANPGDGYATVISASVGYYCVCPGPSDISAYVYYSQDASTSCSSDGSLYIYVTGGDGTNNYDYTAYDSTNGSTYTGTANSNYFGIYGLATGNYSITISDAANPGDGYATVITGSVGYYSACPGPSDISAYVYYSQDASTSCSNDGSLYIYATGGDGTNNYDYTAYDSTNGSTYTGTANSNYFGIYGLTAGNYSITISDASNPGDGYAAVITGSVGYYSACPGPSDISAYVYYSQDASTSCSSDGSLYVYVTGGDDTNNYVYTAFDSTDDSTYTGTASGNYFGIYGLTAGNYSITISDAANPGDGFATVITAIVNSDLPCEMGLAPPHPPTNVSGIDSKILTDEISIWSYGNRVYIDFTNLSDVNATIEMYNVLGQEITGDKCTNNIIFTKELNTVEACYVLVTVINNGDITTKKVFILNAK